MFVVLLILIFTEPLYNTKLYAYSMVSIRASHELRFWTKENGDEAFWKYLTEPGGGPSHGFVILILMLWHD